jgi:hypothetical protein
MSRPKTNKKLLDDFFRVCGIGNVPHGKNREWSIVLIEDDLKRLFIAVVQSMDNIFF